MNPIADELRAFTLSDTGAENIAAETIHECVRAYLNREVPTNPTPVNPIPADGLPAQVPAEAVEAAGMVTLHLIRVIRRLAENPDREQGIDTDLPARYAAWAVLEAINAGKRVAR